MNYHPIMGILIFFFAVVVSFLLGKYYIKKKSNIYSSGLEKKNITQGEITSPDAPWLNEK